MIQTHEDIYDAERAVLAAAGVLAVAARAKTAIGLDKETCVYAEAYRAVNSATDRVTDAVTKLERVSAARAREERSCPQ